MIINFITAELLLPSMNSFIGYVLHFSKKDLMWHSIETFKRTVKSTGRLGKQQRQLEITHDLVKGEGDYTITKVGVYFTNEVLRFLAEKAKNIP